MINLGFKSGRDMPNVYLELAPMDRILEGLCILLTAAAWVLAVLFYFDSPSPSGRLFISPGAMTAFTVIFFWASRAPIRLYNFPVKLNERNYVMQYLIATRLSRVVGLIGNLILFFGLFIELAPQLGVESDIFLYLMHLGGGLLLASLIVYYILAFRNR